MGKYKGISHDEIRKQYIKAIKHTDGRQISIAKYLGVNASTAKRYMDKYEDIKQMSEMRRKMMVERAEEHLERYVEDGNWKAVKYVLSTLGRDVYSTKTETSISVDTPPTINIKMSDEDTEAKIKYGDIDGLIDEVR